MSKQFPVAKLIFDQPDDPDQVSAMAVSMGDPFIGQIHPVQIVPDKRDKFRVIAGRVRAAAAVALGWKTLAVDERPYGTTEEILSAELVGIDEDLYRRNRSPSEEALLIGRRKVVYERLHPETKNGGDRRSAKAVEARNGNGNGSDIFGPVTYTEHQSRLSGRSQRSIQRSARRATLGDDLLARTRGTALDDGRQLDALIQLPTRAREKLVEAAVRGETVSAMAEVRQRDRERRIKGTVRDLGLEQRFDLLLIRHDEAIEDNPPVEQIVEDDGIVCLLVPGNRLQSGQNLLNRWGFAKAAHMVWCHDDPVETDDMLEIRHHLLLIGVRGNPAEPDTKESSVITGAVGSAGVPEQLFKMLGRMFRGQETRVQMLDRKARSGWETWTPPAIEQQAEPEQIEAPVKRARGRPRKEPAHVEMALA